MLLSYVDPFFTGLTRDLALRSRDLHGVGLDGCCLYCASGTPWPCVPFGNAQHTLEALAASLTLPRRQPGVALAAIRR